jgi:hypothetical protein
MFRDNIGFMFLSEKLYVDGKSGGRILRKWLWHQGNKNNGYNEDIFMIVL